MSKMVSACGVLCSDCPAYLADMKGPDYQQRVAKAWREFFGRNDLSQDISCHGCLSPDDQVFHTSRKCQARLCCLSRIFTTCAECPVESCPTLEKAQSIWDAVPEFANVLSPEDFATYARPYCDHRRRLEELRHSLGHPPRIR